MAKKNQKLPSTDKIEIESDQTPGDTTLPDSHSQGDRIDQLSEEQPSATEENGLSPDDLLDDVRRSLIEEESENKKETKWWQRIGRKNKTATSEPHPPAEEIDLPVHSLQTDMVEQEAQATEPDEYTEQINDLIDLLESEDQESKVETVVVAAEPQIPPEPEPEIDIERLKEQAFRPRAPEEVESDVRSIALEGGEEVFVEVEAQAVDPFEERLKSIENALKPYRSYIYITFAFLGVIMAAIASLFIFNAYQQSRPEPVKEVSNLPYPVSVSLPGGWIFNLGRGTLQAGQWEPAGAEWLEGTEACRWVSLPWSRQLEAVLRTLNPNDPIELVMSNNDKLVYSVYSIYEMTPEEIHQVDANSPCLLLILTGSDSEKRWVLTALP